MSYATYLANRLAAQQKVVSVRKPTDASHFTHKKRLEATQFFDADGQGTGSLAISTDRPVGPSVLTRPAMSYLKHTKRPGDASSYTAYRGHVGIGTDAPYKGSAQKVLPCYAMPTVDSSKYKTAADATKDKIACDQSNALLEPPKFVDTTIRLSAMQPDMVEGCPDGPFVKANHDAKEGIHPPSHSTRAVNQTSTIVTSPPGFQNSGVGGKRAGAYYNPRSGYVENKHGNDLRVNPKRVPTRFVYSESIAHLKINNPTFANVKPA